MDNGDPTCSFTSQPSSQGIYKSGKTRYLAVAAPKRIEQMPDVPTVAEAGDPAELDVNSFVSLLSPRDWMPLPATRFPAIWCLSGHLRSGKN